MNAFKSYSQAAQDRWICELLVKPENLLNGTFIDVGCCHPTELSNTYALEQLGWRGLLIDLDPGAWAMCAKQRKGMCVNGDATKASFADLLDVAKLPRDLTYLSLDVDSASLAALENLMRADVKFRAITIETDFYRFGDEPRSKMRQILFQRGYDLVCADVCSADGLPYEDWWVEPALSDRAERFRCANKKWTEIFPK